MNLSPFSTFNAHKMTTIMKINVSINIQILMLTLKFYLQIFYVKLFFSKNPNIILIYCPIWDFN